MAHTLPPKPDMIDKEFIVPGCNYKFNTNSPIDDALIRSIISAGNGVVYPTVSANSEPVYGQHVRFNDAFYGTQTFTYITQLNTAASDEDSLFGRIWKVQDTATGLFHVVKLQPWTRSDVTDGAHINAFKEYIKQWLIYTITTEDTIDCPHTPPTYGFYFQPDSAGSIYTYQLMALVEGQNFNRYLATETNISVFGRVCHTIGRKINTLQNWITFYHCDLHLKNVRVYKVGSNWNVVLIDFGSTYIKVGNSVIKNTSSNNNNVPDIEARTDLKKLDLATLFSSAYEMDPDSCRLSGGTLKWPFNHIAALMDAIPMPARGKKFHNLYTKNFLRTKNFPTEPDNSLMLNPVYTVSHEKVIGNCITLSMTIPVSSRYVYKLHPIAGNPFRPLIVDLGRRVTDIDAVIAKARADIDAIKLALIKTQTNRRANIVANVGAKKANRKFLADEEARREREKKTYEDLQHKAVALALLTRPTATKAERDVLVHNIVMEPPVLPKPLGLARVGISATSGTAPGTASGPAPGTASGPAPGTASGPAPGTASGTAGTASGTAGTASGPAGTASGTAGTAPGGPSTDPRIGEIRKLFQWGGGFQIELRNGTKVTVPDNISGFGLIAMSELYPRNPVSGAAVNAATVNAATVNAAATKPLITNETGAGRGGFYKRTRRAKKQRKSSRKYRILK